MRTTTQRRRNGAAVETAGYYVGQAYNGHIHVIDKQTGGMCMHAPRKRHEEKHIPGAICIPNETIGSDEIKELPDKDQLILVYCRSGNRSKQASEKLAALGYTNIVEFGGINDWPGETVSGNG